MFLRNILASRITPQTLFEMFNTPDYAEDKFKLLLEEAVKQGISLNIQHPEDAETPYKNVTLLEYCCKFLIVDIVKFLLENGADPNYGGNLNKSLHILAGNLPDPRGTIITNLLLK